MKKFFIFFLFIFIVIKQDVLASEPAYALVINQVRGTECCSIGSLEFLKRQIKAHIDKKIPGYFALRHDVLVNNKWMDFIKDTVKNDPKYIIPALFLEITPDLAIKSKVNHDITQENWYEAQNAYTIGYNIDERVKLVDNLFLEFYNQFGFYPKVVSAWMIDTPTLNYIHDRYGVMIQQITREQYGTDSYTLYGGPPHYPYPASRNWLFIPDYENSNPVLIVRQTITDPLYNYGDKTSTYTSQPNDYMKAGRSFGYFTSLLTETFSQPLDHFGFALLGLENSMDEKYQREFEAQLELVGKLGSKKNIFFADANEMYKYWSKQKMTLYSGFDLVNSTENRAFWITTPKYRVRLLVKNNQMLITDLRIYDKSYSDPYNEYSSQKNGYWIVPYLIDGSFNYKFDSKKLPFKGFFNQQKEKFLFQFDNDIKNETDSLELPKVKELKSLNFEKLTDRIVLSYISDDSKKISIIFLEDLINISPIEKNQLVFNQYNKESSPLLYKTEGNTGFKISYGKDNGISGLFKYFNDGWEISFTSTSKSLLNLRKLAYPYLFPEPVGRTISQLNSFLAPHNQFAIAGRNPVRLFFSAKDVYGLPIIVKENVDIKTSLNISKKEVVKNFANQYIQYVDLYNDKPASTKVSLIINNSMEIPLKQKVYFAPNCKKEFAYCLTHPLHAYWFLKSYLGDKFRK